MKKPIYIGLTEEAVLNDDAFDPILKGWRYYRIEYGGWNEDCVYEGCILLPPDADPEEVEELLKKLQGV